MMPNGFEWVIIITMLLIRALPIIAVVLLIVVLWKHLRKDKKERGRQETVEQDFSSEGHSDAPGLNGSAVPARAVAEPRAPLGADRSEAIERALLGRGLTERERVIVMGMYAGKTHATLAEELYLSRSTVGTYCKRAYEKLGVADKDSLVAYLDGIA